MTYPRPNPVSEKGGARKLPWFFLFTYGGTNRPPRKWRLPDPSWKCAAHSLGAVRETNTLGFRPFPDTSPTYAPFHKYHHQPKKTRANKIRLFSSFIAFLTSLPACTSQPLGMSTDNTSNRLSFNTVTILAKGSLISPLKLFPCEDKKYKHSSCGEDSPPPPNFSYPKPKMASTTKLKLARRLSLKISMKG